MIISENEFRQVLENRFSQLGINIEYLRYNPYDRWCFLEVTKDELRGSLLIDYDSINNLPKLSDMIVKNF